MSTQPDPSQPGDDNGLSKYIKRMRTVLKRSSSSRGGGSVSSSQDVPSATAESKKTATPKPTTTAPAQKPAPKPAPQPVIMTHWSAVQEEKARALFAKYGMTLEPGEWKSTNDMTVKRVTKPIRMRVRRTCHRCQTTFGPDKVCVNCQHVRCKKCPRYPPAKSQDRAETALHTLLAKKDKEPVAPRKAKDEPLTMPSRTGGQDVVRKPVRQRIRRTCHRCSTTFAAGATECASCQHIRCKICPRDPPKLHKYPDGYPGDVDPPVELPTRTFKKPRQRVRYTCHEKGPETIRDPPKKHKPEPDPEIVKRVEERLMNLKLSTG
ncbi:hypothetical protein FE257_006572 [Aspergillus nanangensis]|uniref:Uncharacterized protein n=1 Tax=Aspergillus nanangensis TaxID=2582783 RepID=A0AAD4CY56_ASPNN|nr:hypothetical protein FE257_006572 [Aspergillus nanangensis]